MTILVLLLLFPANAQWQTLDRKIVTNYDTGDSVDAVIPNIGQTQHQVQFIYSNAASGGPCGLGDSTSLFIESSHDGTTWTRLSPVVTRVTTIATNTFAGNITANGAYPRLRLSRSTVPVGCRLNAWYMGTLPSLGVASFSPGISGQYLDASVSTSVAGNFDIVTPAAATQRVVVYGMEVWTGSGGTNTLFLTERQASCTGTITNTLFHKITAPPDQEWVRQRHYIPYHIAQPGNRLCLQTSAAIFTGVRLIYRFE